MKVLFKKLKRTKLSIRLIYYFVLILFLVSYILFTKSLLLLNGIETAIRIIVIIVLGYIVREVVYSSLMSNFTKHPASYYSSYSS